MRLPLAAAGVLLGLALAVPAARAQGWGPPCPPAPPRAPDACGPGFYSVNCYGQQYGPNYWVYPPFAPFNGMPMAGGGGGGGMMGGPVGFPTHPFAHGPRDYFMMDP